MIWKSLDELSSVTTTDQPSGFSLSGLIRVRNVILWGFLGLVGVRVSRPSPDAIASALALNRLYQRMSYLTTVTRWIIES